MTVHITRQPVLDGRQKLFAYQLLARPSWDQDQDESSRDQAAARLLTAVFLDRGLEAVSAGRPCFIRFSRDLLLGEIATALPKNRLIVEIGAEETAVPEVVATCRHLSGLGYILALDGFAFVPGQLPLVELANIVKIDFRCASLAEIEKSLHNLSPYRIKTCATNIDTRDAFDQARLLGCNYFQGHFFARPEPLAFSDIPAGRMSLLRILAEVNSKQPSPAVLEAIVVGDVGLAYKLLRYINSSYYYLLKEVDSIRQAIVYLGEVEFRRFVNLVGMTELAGDKPDELVRLSMVRARFCELLAKASSTLEPDSQWFLLGLFSLLDALLDAPMEQVMDQLPLSSLLKEALILKTGPLAPLYRFLLAYEEGSAEDCRALLPSLGLGEEQAASLYLEALRFAAELIPD